MAPRKEEEKDGILKNKKRRKTTRQQGIVKDIIIFLGNSLTATLGSYLQGITNPINCLFHF